MFSARGEMAKNESYSGKGVLGNLVNHRYYKNIPYIKIHIYIYFPSFSPGFIFLV